MFDKVKKSPYVEHAFRLQLVEDAGGEGESIVVGLPSGEIGVVVRERQTKSRRFPLHASCPPQRVRDSRPQ